MSNLSHQPKQGENVFIAPNATVIGNVQLSKGSSVWYGAVLRGDNDLIFIGENTNIQDLSVVHVDPGKPVHIGKNCTVGHRAIIHGAYIDDNVLVGMGAILMNHVKIGKNCIIGAGALVTEGKEVPEGSLVLGSPAKVVKQLSTEQIKAIQKNADVYVENAKRFMKL